MRPWDPSRGAGWHTPAPSPAWGSSPARGGGPSSRGRAPSSRTGTTRRPPGSAARRRGPWRGPGDTWRGMKVALQVDRDAVSAAYKLWARKIEVMLKSQDPWKIKAGLSKQEYVVGIDGQRVRIDPNMVKFAETLPENVIEEQFNGGVVYLDTEMTPEILGEGYAKELVNIIKDIRKDIKLGDEAGIETRIRASEDSVRLLKS